MLVQPIICIECHLAMTRIPVEETFHQQGILIRAESAMEKKEADYRIQV